MYTRSQKHTYRPELYGRNQKVLDIKAGDVNGDGIIDKVFLYGNKPESPGGFSDNITLVIQDGRSHRLTTVQFQSNAGYHTRIFLEDFNKDHVSDILVSIDSGGSGGYGFFYLYSFKNNHLQEMFNVEKYNSLYKFNVTYEDYYKVRVDSPRLQLPFIIDISHKGKDYLSQYYFENGKLKKPTKGDALALGALYPIVRNEKITTYDLLAYQRIIGTFNADTLGYIVNHLTWKDSQFVSSQLSLSISGKMS